MESLQTLFQRSKVFWKYHQGNLYNFLYQEDFDIKYKEWIITYSDESFEKLADSLEILIETNKEKYDINQAKYLYRRAMELELDFFNAYSDF